MGHRGREAERESRDSESVQVERIEVEVKRNVSITHGNADAGVKEVGRTRCDVQEEGEEGTRASRNGSQRKQLAHLNARRRLTWPQTTFHHSPVHTNDPASKRTSVAA